MQSVIFRIKTDSSHEFFFVSVHVVFALVVNIFNNIPGSQVESEYIQIMYTTKHLKSIKLVDYFLPEPAI